MYTINLNNYLQFNILVYFAIQFLKQIVIFLKNFEFGFINIFNEIRCYIDDYNLYISFKLFFHVV